MGSWWRYPPLRNALAAGLIAAAGFVLAHVRLIPEGIENFFYWVAIPLGGWHWAREGIEELVREREVGIEILMLAATAGSGFLGLWDEAAALVFLYGAAEGTEEYTYARTRHFIRALLDLAPKEARVLRDGHEVTVPAESLEPGELFVVRPGEALATDGVIREGRSSLDESPVTGESIPVDKGPGEKVFAASINRQGALTIEATATFADNTLAKIIHLVEEAQERKGKAQQWIERFGRRYTPAVLAVALGFLVAPVALDLPWETWSVRAVVLLVAAAPCALIMSMPVAMAAGIGSAGRRGILIKGGAHLEHLGTIRVVAFDKTGTLTHGRPAVTDLRAFAGTEQELLAAAAALEHYSEHPLARAIVEHARGAGVMPPPADASEALAGAGARGEIGERIWYVGSPSLFATLGSERGSAEAEIARLQSEGKTVVLVGEGQRVRGLIALQDRLRADARATIARLHALGIRTVMLTGDNRRTADAVARTVGIDDVRAELKPDDKVRAVGQLQREHGAVLMVGDGVNDAPALAAATCGMAMGAAGTDAAIEAADVALMADDLGKIEEALRLGRKARRVSAQNIVFSILVLVALIPSAVAGWISVAFAVLVHEASELLAVANGLRAGRMPEAGQEER
ncbi:cadmium transporter ATPase [Sulfurifustis variabilis]|uniref:P-type Zn(2+) transporter n=1 Tax=Sulfurifustis variabilis TaxID=1675686 RepID=A0A1C7AEU2_9GAMM|nr:cadmium transporter ATPase [Sulfurifustis variabilis]